MKIVWHKHNLIVSSLVGSSHHDKYSYEIPHKYLSEQAFIQALLSAAVSPQRFSFFTVCLVNCLHEVSPRWTAKENNLKLRSPDCRKMHFRHSFWLQKHSLYIADKHYFFKWISVENISTVLCLLIFLSAAAAIFVRVFEFYGEFWSKVDKKDT